MPFPFSNSFIRKRFYLFTYLTERGEIEIENVYGVLHREKWNPSMMHLQGLSLAHASLVGGQTKQSITYHILHIIVTPDYS